MFCLVVLRFVFLFRFACCNRTLIASTVGLREQRRGRAGQRPDEACRRQGARRRLAFTSTSLLLRCDPVESSSMGHLGLSICTPPRSPFSIVASALTFTSSSPVLAFVGSLPLSRVEILQTLLSRTSCKLSPWGPLPWTIRTTGLKLLASARTLSRSCVRAGACQLGSERSSRDDVDRFATSCCTTFRRCKRRKGRVRRGRSQVDGPPLRDPSRARKRLSGFCLSPQRQRSQTTTLRQARTLE